MTDYERLKELCDEIDLLIEKKVTCSDPKFKAWKVKADRYLIKKFGETSYEYREFKRTPFSLLAFSSGTPESRFVAACRDDLQSTKQIFLTYLHEMEEDASNPTQEQIKGLQKSDSDTNYQDVFIVHGHDKALRESVARLLEHQDIRPIILNEQANLGLTLIEKVEKYGETTAAICLFTADDTGKSFEEEVEQKRARQNVILETGYFIGKLGRSKVIIVSDKGIEIPSDLQGIVYTDSGNWELDVLRDLKAIGYKIDYNKLD